MGYKRKTNGDIKQWEQADINLQNLACKKVFKNSEANNFGRIIPESNWLMSIAQVKSRGIIPNTNQYVQSDNVHVLPN